MTYAATDTSGEQGLNFDSIRVITDGGTKLRITPNDSSGSYLVRNGAMAAAPRQNANGDGFDGYEVVKVSEVPRFVLHEGDGTLEPWCHDPKQAAAGAVLKRHARHYTCAPGHAETQSSLFSADELWLDDATGLVLQWRLATVRLTATAIDLRATLPADTFAMPAAAPGSSPGSTIHPFTVPLVGGGTLTDQTYRTGEVVYLSGSATELRSLIARLLPLTHSGATPHVVGLWRYDDFKDLQGSLLNQADVAAWAKQISAATAPFAVPVGIDFKGQVRYTMTPDADPANQAPEAIVVAANGRGLTVVPATASDADLASAIKARS